MKNATLWAWARRRAQRITLLGMALFAAASATGIARSQGNPIHQWAKDPNADPARPEALSPQEYNINATTDKEWTPLHEAATDTIFSGNKTNYRLLQELGANRQIKDNNGKRASDYYNQN